VLLRESGQHDGVVHTFDNINGESIESSTVEHAAVLTAYAEGFAANDRYALSESRAAVQSTFGDEGLVDAAATVAIFNAVVRIADATGISLEPYKVDSAADLRQSLGIDDYRHTET
jgi:hypothetical protein